MEDRHACKVVERSDAAIDPCEAIDFVSSPGYGGIDVFIGKVRDLNHGRPVLGISYDLFQPLVLNEFQRMIGEELTRWAQDVKTLGIV